MNERGCMRRRPSVCTGIIGIGARMSVQGFVEPVGRNGGTEVLNVRKAVAFELRRAQPDTRHDPSQSSYISRRIIIA